MRYIVKARLYDGYSEEYSGRRHKTLESAQRELKQAQNDLVYRSDPIVKDLYIVERPVISAFNAVNDIISVCAARQGERCKDCVYQGERCEDLKRIYWVSKPLYIEKIDCDEETED